MTACLLVGAVALGLAGPDFTLRWMHSVEHVGWQEDWRIEEGGLRLVTARVKGSGAGMEPGEGARLVGDWWVWSPGTRVDSLHLAASGATGGGWELCPAGGAGCIALGEQAAAPLQIAPCPQ
jgi:hypothetical protein